MDFYVPSDGKLTDALWWAAAGDTIHVAATYDASVEGPVLIGKDITIEGDGGRAKLPAFGILGEHTLELRNATVAGTYTSEEGDTASIYQLGGGLVLDDVVFTSTKSTAVAAAFTWVDAKNVVASGFTTKPVMHFYVADVHIEGARFEKNQRNVIVAQASNVVVQGTVFSDNTDLVDETPIADDLPHAPAGADVLGVRSAVTLIDTAHTRSSSAYGGALLLVDGTLDVSGSTFTDTEALLVGGAIAMARDDLDGDGVEDGPGTHFSIDGAAFTGTRAGAGGAIAVLGGDGELRSVSFTDTLAVYTELFGSTEDELVAGGAIAADGATLIAQDLTFDAPYADEIGGAMLLTATDASFEGLTVTGATSGYGGAIATFEGSLSLTDASLTGNGATIGGAVIAVSPTAFSMRRSLLCGNDATDGAGVLLYRGSSDVLEIANTRFVQNTGSAAVAVRTDETTPNAEPLRVENVTFAGNGAAAVEASAGTVKVLNGLVVEQPKGFLADGAARLYVDWTGWSDVPTPTAGATEGEGLLAAADPMWTEPVSCEASLWLGAGSPARDAGDPSLQDADGTTSDLGAWGGAGVTIPDGDGDGSLADQDCDDTRPDVFPGAPEIWYDGVDQDCAGGDDNDQDGDGYALFAGDCDDRDPLRNPETVEIENDRVDQDCDGVDNGDFEWLNGGGGGCATAGVGRASVPAFSGLLLLLLGRRGRRPRGRR